ncbi:MAG: hypothetical protein IKN63_04835, partial [Bacilli bacterium]|nr:hypothetical protein [Bacilli bacterium]
TYINCETNITKSGNVQFGVDYSDISLECKKCQFTISPGAIDFYKTKVINQNTNKEMSQTSLNTLTVSSDPKFILYFYDRFFNSITDENEVKKLDIITKIEVTDIKLCVQDSKLNKISYICKASNNDENDKRWKFVPNGDSYQYIVSSEEKELIFPVQITGGYNDGEAGPIDFTKTYITPLSLTLIAGKEGSFSLELRTKNNVRKNYWYSITDNHIRFSIPNEIKDCKYYYSRGLKPGQYAFLFTCTQKRDYFHPILIVENNEVPQDVSIKVVPNKPAWSELFTLEGTKILNKELGTVSVEDKFQMMSKLYDKYDNLITDINFDLFVTLKLKIATSITFRTIGCSAEPVAQKNGEVLITLKSTYAGEHTLTGALLPLENYNIIFTHGAPSADNSILEVSKKVATAGETIYIYITPYDKYSNLIDANEYKDTSPYQVKYISEGETTKVITEKHSIEVKDDINVISYPGVFYVKGYTNFYGYLDTQQIKCISCRVEILSGDFDFKSSLVMRYDSSKSDYEILKNGIVEKNAQEDPIYRLYPRDKYLNSLDYIPEDKIQYFKSRLESQSETTTYHFKLNNKEYTNQQYAEFVVNENSEISYTNLVAGYYNLIFNDKSDTLKYNISLLGDGKGGSNEPADYQNTHINDQNLKFKAGESGYIMLEIRTSKNIRSNSWNYDVRVESCNKEDTTFKATSSKAGLLGVFQVTVTTQKANTYPKLETCQLKIYINNTLVENLHPEMEVSPNEVVETKILEKYYKSNSNTELLDGMADITYQFEVASYDQYNNLAETNQELIGLKITYKGGSEYKTISENDINTGYRKYIVSATKSGTYIVSTSKSGPKGIYMKNEATFLINPGEIDLTKTVIKEKTTPIQAGEKPVISIIAYDKYGNMLEYTNYMDKFSSTFFDAKGNEFNSSPNYDSGVKKVFYTSNNEVTVVGNIKVEVIYDNKENVDASSIIIEVYPGEPYPPHSILSRETSSGIFTEYLDGDSFEVNVKEALLLNVTLYDKYKNYVNNLPINAEVLEPLLAGNKMNPITFTILKNTGNFDLDFNSEPKYVYTYQHLIKGNYDLTYKVKTSLGEKDFHYYVIVNNGDDLHGNGEYVISKCVLKPTETVFTAGNYEKFTLELRTEEGLLYNDDIDINKDIKIGEVDDTSFKYGISKSGSDYGIYTISIYSEKKGEYTLNVALTDPSSTSGEKKNINSAKYKVTPDPIPDKTKTQITKKPESSIFVDTPIEIQFNLFDKFNNKIEKSDNIIQISYFSLLNH